MIYIGDYKEFDEDADVSMKDYFSSKPYKGMEKIIQYLKNGETVAIAASFDIDVITNEEIEYEKSLKTDGKYEWPNKLIYYIEKYYLRLPEEIENYILNKKA